MEKEKINMLETIFEAREEGLETHEYIMTTTSVNYQEMIEKYTMPFNLLWALLVTGVRIKQIKLKSLIL